MNFTRSTQAVLSCSVLLSLLCSGGCKKEESVTPTSTISPLPASEVKRGRKACTSYVARVCACAEKNTKLADECALASGIPEAFELSIVPANTTGLNNVEMSVLKSSARKIAAKCFEADNKLDTLDCPRISTK